MEKEIRSITARQAVEICKQDGLILTLEEAQLVLDFMYKFSKLTLEVLLKADNYEAKANR